LRRLLLNALAQRLLQAGQLLGRFARVAGHFDRAVEFIGDAVQLVRRLGLMLDRLVGLTLLERLGSLLRFLGPPRVSFRRLGRLPRLACEALRLLGQLLLLAGNFGQAFGVPLPLGLGLGFLQVALGLRQLASAFGELLRLLGAGLVQCFAQRFTLLGQTLQ